jgi:hypothetical protein
VDHEGLQAFPGSEDADAFFRKLLTQGQKIAADLKQRTLDFINSLPKIDPYATNNDYVLYSSDISRAEIGTTGWVPFSAGSLFGLDVNNGKGRCGVSYCAFIKYVKYLAYSDQRVFIYKQRSDPFAGPTYTHTFFDPLLSRAQLGVIDERQDLVCTPPKTWHPCKITCPSDIFRPK